MGKCHCLSKSVECTTPRVNCRWTMDLGWLSCVRVGPSVVTSAPPWCGMLVWFCRAFMGNLCTFQYCCDLKLLSKIVFKKKPQQLGEVTFQCSTALHWKPQQLTKYPNSPGRPPWPYENSRSKRKENKTKEILNLPECGAKMTVAYTWANLTEFTCNYQIGLGGVMEREERIQDTQWI